MGFAWGIPPSLRYLWVILNFLALAYMAAPLARFVKDYPSWALLLSIGNYSPSWLLSMGFAWGIPPSLCYFWVSLDFPALAHMAALLTWFINGYPSWALLLNIGNFIPSWLLSMGFAWGIPHSLLLGMP